MAILPIIYAPHKILDTPAEKIETIDDKIRKMADDMVETMYHEHAVGLGANMVGISKHIVTIDLQENGIKKPYIMFNPEIIEKSTELQEFEEASLSLPGISAIIKRPNRVAVKYLDYNGNEEQLEATGFFATVIQHEIDYLHGITYLKYLSPLKRSLLRDKMIKYIKEGRHKHVHTANCRH